MASTNKTTNLSLSQFIATDKPSWLSDYNADMAKIDAGYGKAISDSASAVSGAASASAAAQAAQNTANSAETRSVNNASQIKTIKNMLTAKLVTAQPINGGNGPLNIAYSPLFVNAKGSIQFAALPSDTVVVGGATRFGMWSLPDNIFNLKVSNLSDNTEKFTVGVASLRCNTSGTQNFITNLTLLAYYDGANTIIYGSLGTSFYSTVTALSNIWINAMSFISGSTFDINE